jgi:hypothetical protein
MRLFTLALVAGTLASAPSRLEGQDQRALMVDEAWRDPELVLVRHDIVVSALRHDTASLRPNLETRFLSSFGGGGGIDEFFGSLNGSPGLWNELIEVLSLGGRLGTDAASFSAPFWAAGVACTPLAGAEATTSDTTPDIPTSNFDCDGFGVLLVLGTKVRVRATPGGAPIDAITLDLVNKDRQRSDGTTPDGTVWTPIIMRNGTHGWIAARLLRSPIGRRASFQKGPDGRWRMSSFVEGD